MSCRTNRSSVNWGERLAREPGMSAPPATSPECRALVADAEAAARYLATYGMKIRGATVEETEAARYALPRTPGIDPLPGPLPPGWEMAGDRRRSGVRALDGIEQAYQVPDQFVEIYVSAGPSETNNASCDADHDGNCLLYRVLWNLPRGELVSMERVDDDPEAGGGSMGEIQPALSPDGRQLAWIRRFRDGAGGNELVTRHRDVLERRTVSGTGEQPEFPNWYSNDVLLFHHLSHPASGGSDDEKVKTLWARTGDAAPVAVLGFGSSYAPRKSFQDADTHPDPAYRANAGPRVVTFGGPGGKKQPRVTGLSGGPEENFHLGFRDESDECHHPAWNIEGSRILCHRNQPPETVGAAGQWLKALFEYEYSPPRLSSGGGYGAAGTGQLSSTSAGGGGRVFDPKTPDQLEQSLPAFSATRCDTYFYKYAEWCGTDDYVLATVYCRATNRGPVVSSRVIIIHLREPVVFDEGPRPRGTRYSDVTLAMEKAAGVDRQSWRGIFGTCSTPVRLSHPRVR